MKFNYKKLNQQIHKRPNNNDFYAGIDSPLKF